MSFSLFLEVEEFSRTEFLLCEQMANPKWFLKASLIYHCFQSINSALVEAKHLTSGGGLGGI